MSRNRSRSGSRSVARRASGRRTCCFSSVAGGHSSSVLWLWLLSATPSTAAMATAAPAFVAAASRYVTLGAPAGAPALSEGARLRSRAPLSAAVSLTEDSGLHNDKDDTDVLLSNLAQHDPKMGDHDDENTMVNGEGSYSPSSSSTPFAAGRLEEMKAEEAGLRAALESIRQEKRSNLQSRPLTIGVIGFGRFGQFIARTFSKYGHVVVTSRSDYTDIANGMGATYVPLSDPASFFNHDLDVIVVAVSILSFEATVRQFVPPLQMYLASRPSATIDNLPHGPLIVDVLSVKEHPRQVLLDLLPSECDILCTHPMFGPDSGHEEWTGLNFVYERTRVDGVVLENSNDETSGVGGAANAAVQPPPTKGAMTSSSRWASSSSPTRIHANDRVERFLSIWEEEGCRMVKMTCAHHDVFAANSQFITHLVGRILGQQGLEPTPIDTKGFDSVLQLIGSTAADSFDLFYGLYKYNVNSLDTIVKLKTALDNVVNRLSEVERDDRNVPVRHSGKTLVSIGAAAMTTKKDKAITSQNVTSIPVWS